MYHIRVVLLLVSAVWTAASVASILPPRAVEGNRLVTDPIEKVQSSSYEWRSRNWRDVQQWLAHKREMVLKNPPQSINPSLQDFRNVVYSHSDLAILANAMFEEVPLHAPYNQDPTGAPTVRSFDEMLVVLDHIMQEGPPFYDRQQPTTAMGLVGAPINAILDWPMGTLSGNQFFLSPIVNAELQKVLDTWAKFLGSPASQLCLDGWLSRDGKEVIAQAGNDGKTTYTFEQLFDYPNASAPYLGYTSWDEYFVRKFRDGIRPIEAPDNGPLNHQYPDPTAVITNACESAPLQVQSGVQLFDNFYLKGQPYSLTNMLNFSPLAHTFVNGTVYQAYLSALSYHRWHAPVSGRVLKIEHVAGTYYSSNLYTGLALNGSAPDSAAPNESQPYISAVATRGIIYIQADNPKIGMMAIVFIGMAEVSSCEFTVKEGARVEKGDEIGMFHYGGSSHVMIFRPGVDLNFVTPPPWHIDTEQNFQVRSALAVVS